MGLLTCFDSRHCWSCKSCRICCLPNTHGNKTPIVVPGWGSWVIFPGMIPFTTLCLLSLYICEIKSLGYLLFANICVSNSPSVYYIKSKTLFIPCCRRITWLVLLPASCGVLHKELHPKACRGWQVLLWQNAGSPEHQLESQSPYLNTCDLPSSAEHHLRSSSKCLLV